MDKKKYVITEMKVVQMNILHICEDSHKGDYGGTVDPDLSKKRGKNSTTEDIFEDEEETSFWH